MKTNAKYTPFAPARLVVLLMGLLLLPLSLCGQTTTCMVDGDSIVLDACTLGGGVIYDDGGPVGKYSNNFEGWVVIQASPGNTIHLTGYGKTDYYYDELTVHDGNTTLLYASSTFDVDVSSTSGLMVIKFKTNNSGINDGFELTWTLEGASTSCSNPVSNLQQTAATTGSIMLSWSADIATGPFTVRVGDSVYSNSVSTTSYTVTGLNASSAYEVEVIATSAAGDRCCGDRILARTECGSVDMPYTEGFEGMIEGSFPDCWVKVVNFDDEDYQPQVVAAQYSSGRRGLMTSCGNSNSQGHFGIIATPVLKAGTEYSLRVKMRSSHNPLFVQVGLCDSTGTEYDQYNFVQQGTSIAVNNTSNWQEYIFTVTPPSAGKRLALRMVQNEQYGVGRILYLDDISLAPCGVKNLTVSHIDHNSMRLSWDEYGSPTCNLGVRRQGASADTISLSNVSSPVDLTGLQPETFYQLTLYPTCGGIGMPSSYIVAATTKVPVSASNYCSDFSDMMENTQWKSHSSSGTLSNDRKDIWQDVSRWSYYTSNDNNNDAYIASPQMVALAGQSFQITYFSSTNYSNAKYAVGTLFHADDPSTFVPFDTLDRCDNLVHTQVVHVPSGSTGRYLAIKNTNYNSSIRLVAVSSGDCAIDELHLLHRRGTSLTWGWSQPYDTVLVQYGAVGFAIGTGTIDTFYNATQATIDGLNQYTRYDLFIYRPCMQPCEDMRYSVYTVDQDYDVPFCESFEQPSSIHWYNSYYPHITSVWRKEDTRNNTPEITNAIATSQYGYSLRLSANGATSWSTVALPDVKVDSTSVLGFWITDRAPQSSIVVGVVTEERDSYHGKSQFYPLDTIHVFTYNTNERQHLSLPLRPSDTLFNHRLALRYLHPYEFSNYSAFIDELQITHASYANAQAYSLGCNSAMVVCGDFLKTDSVDCIYENNLVTITERFGDEVVLQTDTLWSNLTYNVYVQPVGSECRSYVGRVSTWCGGGGGGGGFGLPRCFTFNDLGTDTLYTYWASDGSTSITTEGELHLPPASAVAMQKMWNIDELTFSFRAKSSQEGDTLLLVAIEGANVAADTTRFGYNSLAVLPIDTMLLSTEWQSYAITMPPIAFDSLRLCFRTGSGTVLLDDIGLSPCAIPQLETKGSTVVSTMPDGVVYTIYFDSDSLNDHRTIRVEESSYTVENLHLDADYEVRWRCEYMPNLCADYRLHLHTDSTVMLPYCVNFDEMQHLPSEWTLVANTKPGSSAEFYIEGSNSYLSVRNMTNGNVAYAVLPPFEESQALTVKVEGYYLTVGVLTNGVDLSSFVPISPETGRYAGYYDLSDYLGKRVAIRYTSTNGCLYNIHCYNYPIIKDAKRLGQDSLQLNTHRDAPYWLHYTNHGVDTIVYVTDSVYNLLDTVGYYTSSRSTYLLQGCDSLASSCDGSFSFSNGYPRTLPYCREHDYYDADWSRFGKNYSIVNSRRRYPNDLSASAGNSWGAGISFPEVDSLQQLGMRIYITAPTEKDSLVVGVLTDAYDTNTFTPIDTLCGYTGDASIVSSYVDFARYQGTGQWITLRGINRTGAQYTEVQQIVIDECKAALSAHARLVRWNKVEITTDETPLYVEYYKADESWQGKAGNAILRIDSPTTTLTLDPETRYSFHFRCDSLVTNCLPAEDVITLEAPLLVPSCVDFDTVLAGTLPRNWRKRNPDIMVTNQLAHSDTNSLRIPIATNSYVISPDIDIDSMKNLTISVWFKASDLNDRLVVGTMSDPTDLGSFHPIRSLAPLDTASWQHGQVEFKNAPSDAHFLALRARSTHLAAGRSIYVDDLFLSKCAAFDFAVQRITDSSIDLTWQQVGTPSITVTMSEEGGVPQTFNPTEPPLHISQLDMLNYYTFAFSSTCMGSSGFCSTDYTDTLHVVTPAPGTGCVNPTDLASPQAVFYSGTYTNPYSNAGAVNYGSLHPDSRHTVCYDTAQRDPRTGNMLRTIPEGYTSSVRLGNWNTNIYAPEAEGVIYSLYVDTADFELLLLRYAAVLQDPMHAPEDQPRFRMELLDTNFALIDSACTSADFIADQSLGWNMAADGVLWKDWTSVGVDLSAYAGQQVYFRLTTYDCNEGSHYGYAYFTLECRKKNSNIDRCGDYDSVTLVAPEGFHYQWTAPPSTTVISTEQSITRMTSDVTYQCRVSKLDNPSCYFTINAFGGTRFPIAAFTPIVTIDSCRFHVTFANNSGVASEHGGLPVPGLMCHSYEWNYGNGSTDTTFNGSTVYYNQGTYTVTLVSSYLSCTDTATLQLTLQLPDEVLPSDTTVASICDNQSYTFFGNSYNQTDTIREYVSYGSICDSLYMLILDVRATSVGDTFAVVCDSLRWHGSLRDSTGLFYDTLLAGNRVACDSTITLHLTVHPSYDTVDTIRFCPYTPIVYRGVYYGGPAVFDTLLTAQTGCDSLVHVSLAVRDSNYRLNIVYSFADTLYTPIDSIIYECAPYDVYLHDSTPASVAWQWTAQTADSMHYGTDTTFSLHMPLGGDTMTAYIRLITTDTMGCLDTLAWPVVALTKPTPQFRWEPDYPSMDAPEVQFVNLSTPDSTTHYWRIQRADMPGYDTSSARAPFYHWGEPNMPTGPGELDVVLSETWLHYVHAFRPDTISWLDTALCIPMLYDSFSYACTDSLNRTVVIVNDYLQFPNLVTPNDDGTNDTWRIVNLIEYGNYSMNELWIYDRTGALVYHVRNIYREEQFWDPNSTHSPDGTYYFRFMGEGQYGVVKRNGVIEVLRKVDD